MHRCDVAPEDFGPLLLGQLTPSRARAVARQVAACPSCAAEAASLWAVVTALRAYPPPDVVVQEASRLGDGPTPDGLGVVLAGVQAERGRRARRRLLVAVVAAVTVVGVGTPATLLLADLPDRARSSEGIDVRLAGSAPDSTGRASLDARRWGTSIHLEVSGLDPGARYGVWLATADDRRTPAGSFRPTAGGTVELDLSSALPLSAGRVLGVSQLPTEDGGRLVDVLEAELAS